MSGSVKVAMSNGYGLSNALTRDFLIYTTSNVSQRILLGTSNYAPMIINSNNVAVSGVVNITSPSYGVSGLYVSSPCNWFGQRVQIGLGLPNGQGAALYSQVQQNAVNDIALAASSNSIFKDNSLYIKGDTGFVGINTNNPSTQLQVVGTITCTSMTQTSDSNLKNFERLTLGLQSILQLDPVKYTFKNSDDQTNYYGLLAQEVQNVIPTLVVGNSADHNLSIRYTELVPVLINAIKDLSAKVDSLESRITTSSA